MSFSVPFPAKTPARTLPRTVLALFLSVSGSLLLVLALASPAYAFGGGPFGDRVVERGEIVHDDVSTITGDVTVNGIVRGDVESGLGDVRTNGRVDGDIDAGSGDVYIDAPVGGDVNVGRGDVRLGPEASVEGEISSGSGEFNRHPDARFEGSVAAGMAAGSDGFFDDGGSEVLGFVGWVLATLGFVACSVLISVVAPRPLSSAARSLEGSPGWSLFFGVASVPAVVVLSVVLVVSVVGIPALLLLAPAYLALVFFGALVVAYFLGRKALLATGRHRGGDALAAVVGALALSAAALIPLFGTLLLYALALLGTGAVILALFARRPRTTHASYEAYVQDRRDP